MSPSCAPWWTAPALPDSPSKATSSRRQPRALTTLVVSGSVAAVWSGSTADVLLLPVDSEGERRWCVFDAADVVLAERASFDPTRRLAQAQLDAVTVPASRVLARQRAGRRTGRSAGVGRGAGAR